MLRANEFHKLLLGAFISQSGSHLLTLAISGLIFLKTQSTTLASLVFVFSFLPSVLVGSKIGAWVDSRISKALLIRIELLSILSTLICGFTMDQGFSILILCAVLGLRSLLLFSSRSATLKWLKLSTHGSLQGKRIKLYYLSFFLSTAVSGGIAAALLAQESVWVVIGFDVLTYLLGVAAYLTLKPITLDHTASNISEAMPLVGKLKAILNDSSIRSPFLVVCISQALFQGAYSSFVSYLPLKQYSLGATGIGFFQMAASIGITLGFLVNWFQPNLLSEKVQTTPVRTILCFAFASTFLLGSVNVQSASSSLIFFSLMNLAYECVWLHGSSEFFQSVPASRAAAFQFTLSAVSAFSMSLLILIYSAITEVSSAPASVGIVLMSTAFAYLLYLFFPRARSAQAIQQGEVG